MSYVKQLLPELPQRVAGLVITLFLSSVVVFGSTYLVPGDPAVFLAGGEKATPSAIEAIRFEFGLDDPPIQRYFSWLIGIFQGDFGVSLQYREDVGSLIVSRMPISGSLILYSAMLILIFGVTLGLVAAIRGGKTDSLIVGAAGVAVATPPFVSAVALISLFAVGLRWFPSTGAGDPGLDRLWHLTLPAIALSAALSGVIIRVAKSSFGDVLHNDHVLVARSRGLPERKIVTNHVIRNGLGPVVTMSGIIIAGMVVSTTLVESAFGINGIGTLLKQSVERQDFPVIQAISLLVIVTFLICNTVVDLLYPLIDPRVSTSLKVMNT